MSRSFLVSAFPVEMFIQLETEGHAQYEIVASLELVSLG